MKPVYEYKSMPFEVKDLDQKEGVLYQYFSAFNVWDSYKDLVAPGAYTKTLSEQGPASARPRLKHLLNHDVNSPVGRPIEAKEDSYGLLVGSKLGSHNLGQDFIKMVDSGLITEGSIGYATIKKEEVKEGRILKELSLAEVSSLTGWGVNQYTHIVGMKAEDQAIAAIKRLERLEKFCRNTDATDETIEMLLLEVKQLTQLTIDLKSDNTTKPITTITQPENEKGINWDLIANQLITNQFSQR